MSLRGRFDPYDFIDHYTERLVEDARPPSWMVPSLSEHGTEAEAFWVNTMARLAMHFQREVTTCLVERGANEK